MWAVTAVWLVRRDVFPREQLLHPLMVIVVLLNDLMYGELYTLRFFVHIPATAAVVTVVRGR